MVSMANSHKCSAVPDSDERERAITFLSQAIDRKHLRKLHHKLRLEGPILGAHLREGLEAWVMYSLVRGGFNWPPMDYYRIGIDLLEEAAMRAVAPRQAQARAVGARV